MKRVHIVGRKNHGKTTLIVELLEEFRRRGVRAGSVKHSAHYHELDPPGKDSYLHRQAGADPAAIVSNNLIGMFLARHPATDCYARMAPLFADCAVVLVEGDIEASAVKLEVWRAERGTVPLARERGDIRAVISDDQPDVTSSIWPRSDLAALADRILGLAATGGTP